ncbi:flavodoxin I [Ruminiclostridium sufflavum DSM 19573]|uniref:Flavodoxin I n=1 Tax=Ruminiclostridium sufflavum DSM 19573 TaxID=1121337 RepID=A0A318XWW8_9FIRM|nr:flavodoxin family protein [Ruminiclostridium sufflavum]PYG87302.1 flavodoxin I [Ruminiclostridium sufflavum DSM 19573]
MKTWVLYYSRGGNTKKIAEAMAEELEVPKAEQVPPAYPPENVQLLFLGTGIYAGKPDSKMVEFIRTLNTDRVKNAAVFGTNGGQDTAIETVKSLLREKGINVIDETFSCKGKYFLFINRNKPDSEDLKAAKVFARKVYDSLKA